jgi:hypothetical protein
MRIMFNRKDVMSWYVHICIDRKNCFVQIRTKKFYRLIGFAA